jgi:hypothetical protein
MTGMSTFERDYEHEEIRVRTPEALRARVTGVGDTVRRRSRGQISVH